MGLDFHFCQWGARQTFDSGNLSLLTTHPWRRRQTCAASTVVASLYSIHVRPQQRQFPVPPWGTREYLASGSPSFGATFCLWAILCGLLTMEGMEVFLIFGLFLVVYFLVLPRIPWLSRFT